MPSETQRENEWEIFSWLSPSYRTIRGMPTSKVGSWRIPDHSSERRFSAFPRGKCNFIFLRGLQDFKIQLPLYFLLLDWLIRSFPSNLETISHPFTLWVSLGSEEVWFSGRTVWDTNELTNKIANSPEMHRKIWIKTTNIEDLWSRTKLWKTQYNIGAGKELILLLFEHNVSHSSLFVLNKIPLFMSFFPLGEQQVKLNFQSKLLHNRRYLFCNCTW